MQKVPRWWPYLDPLIIGSVQIYSIVVGYQIYMALLRWPSTTVTNEEGKALLWRLLIWLVVQLYLTSKELIPHYLNSVQFIVGLSILVLMGIRILSMTMMMPLFFDNGGPLPLMILAFPFLRVFSIGIDLTRRWRRSYQLLQQA